MTECMDMSRRSVLRNLLAAGVAVPLLAMSASSCTARGGMREVTVAGGENGGFYLEFAILLAEALQRRGVAEAAKPLVTGGSLENLELLRSGKATFAVALADAASDKGTGTAPAMAAVGKVYENYVHCIVRRNSGIGSLGELAGRTVSTGEPRSGTSLTAARILETFEAGTPAFAKNPPVKRSLGLNKGLAALRDGTVDALFWSGGVPTAAIAALNKELDKELGLAFLDLSSVIRPMRERFGPFYDRVRIPEGSYAGAPAAWTVGVANLLLCRQDLDDTTVERTVELLVTRAAELVPQSSAGVQFLSPDTLINTAGVPLHPAAERAYRELHG